MVKKIGIAIACVFIFFGVGFLGGYFARGGSQGSDSEYASRLAAIESINSQLREENRRATEYNRAIAGRLDRAKSIIDGLGKETGGIKDAIQRLERNLSILEQAIQAVFGDN